jgi:hypothetical protein
MNSVLNIKTILEQNFTKKMSTILTRLKPILDVIKLKMLELILNIPITEVLSITTKSILLRPEILEILPRENINGQENILPIFIMLTLILQPERNQK